jgi:hypothetical protein
VEGLHKGSVLWLPKRLVAVVLVTGNSYVGYVCIELTPKTLARSHMMIQQHTIEPEESWRSNIASSAKLAPDDADDEKDESSSKSPSFLVDNPGFFL